MVAVIGSKASVRLKFVALMNLRELVANWKGISVPMITTAATYQQTNEVWGKLGCAGWTQYKANPEKKIPQPVKVSEE